MRFSTRVLDHGEKPDPRRTTGDTPAGPRSTAVVDGPILCDLRIWTEAEWDALPADRRPERFIHAPGLGWVGAVPTECLN